MLRFIIVKSYRKLWQKCSIAMKNELLTAKKNGKFTSKRKLLNY
jgi:hypothetical protein